MGGKATQRTSFSTFNARAETVVEKPIFRSAFKSRRCVISASGHEWIGTRRQDATFSAGEAAPLAFAGLWKLGAIPRATRR
jgi:putative SOS response-associated peptidase YedK